MVPDGWKKVELNEVAPVIDCKHRTPSYSETGIPIVSPGNITWGALQLDGCRTISETEYDSMMDHCDVEVGDLVFGRNQTVGVAARVGSAEKFALGQDTVLIKPKTIDSQFLQAVLQSQETKRQIYKLLGGSTFGRINLKDLRQMQIVFPYMEEQERIAEILATWDRAIETTENLIANSQAQKKALMQQLLTGKKRLPGFDGEWTETAIGEMGTVSSGGTPDSSIDRFWDGDVLWTTPTDITALKSRFIYDTDRKITEQGLAGSAAKVLPAGTILVCTRATVGALAIAVQPISTNQGFKNITPNHKFDSEFLYFLFSYNTPSFVRLASGSTFLELSKKDFEKVSFSVPTKPEQLAISSVLRTASEETEFLQERLAVLKNEKTALMQQLLTGKRRVKIEEAAA